MHTYLGCSVFTGLFHIFRDYIINTSFILYGKRNMNITSNIYYHLHQNTVWACNSMWFKCVHVTIFHRHDTTSGSEYYTSESRRRTKIFGFESRGMYVHIWMSDGSGSLRTQWMYIVTFVSSSSTPQNFSQTDCVRTETWQSEKCSPSRGKTFSFAVACKSSIPINFISILSTTRDIVRTST
jgi:hypothetical protein